MYLVIDLQIVGRGQDWGESLLHQAGWDPFPRDCACNSQSSALQWLQLFKGLKISKTTLPSLAGA